MSESEAATRPPLKTVVLLGAGASKASAHHLPVMRDFFDGLHMAPLGPSERALSAFLRWYYPEIPSVEWSLEEVMSYLHLARGRLPTITRTRRPMYEERPCTFDDLIGYVRRRLHVEREGESTCSLHSRLVKTLQPPDSILTLNYDLVMDHVLESESHERPARASSRLGRWDRVIDGSLGMQLAGGGFVSFSGYSPPVVPLGERIWSDGSLENSGQYLKLHGSLDCVRCSNASCANSQRACRLDEYGYHLMRHDEDLSCRRCGCLLETAIIPPLAGKSLAHGPFLAIWNQALTELMNATKVVLVGLSFSAADVELRWIIKQSVELSGSPAALVIVNPDADAIKVAVRLFGVQSDTAAVRRTHEFESLEAYLHEAESNPIEFWYGA